MLNVQKSILCFQKKKCASRVGKYHIKVKYYKCDFCDEKFATLR